MQKSVAMLREKEMSESEENRSPKKGGINGEIYDIRYHIRIAVG